MTIAPPLTASPVQTPSVTERHLIEIIGEPAGISLHDMYDPVGSFVYHDISRRDTHEIREIVGATRGRSGEVLDLAAGSGRLTVPLLALGRSVTALELSATMLDLLRSRLAELPIDAQERCEIVAGDMRTFELPQRFGTIILGTTSISLLDEAGRADLFDRVRHHLAPDGRFLLSTLEIADGAPSDTSAEVVGASGRCYRLHERVDPAAGVRSVLIHESSPSDRLQVCASAVRIVSPGRLANELARQGLLIEATRPLPTGTDRYRDALLTVRRTDEPRPEQTRPDQTRPDGPRHHAPGGGS